MTVSHLKAVYDRLDRADEHIDSIKKLARSYFASGFDRLGVELNTEVQMRAKGEVDAPPIRMFTIAGECIHNIRSAFDHLAWQLVEAAGGDAPNDQTSFPVLRTRPTANKRGIHPPPHVSGGVSEDALKLIDDEQPYMWGSEAELHPLYVLHDLSIKDKHRHIVLQGVTFQSITFKGDLRTANITGKWRVVGSHDDHAEVVFVPDDPALEIQGSATIAIHISEPGPGIAAPLVGTLTYLRAYASDTIAKFERCF